MEFLFGMTVGLWRKVALDGISFIFCLPCISLQILANNWLDALFHVFIYFISVHVSSITALIVRRSNCVNTSSGMISLCKGPLGMPARREQHTKQSLTQTNHTRWCINTFAASYLNTQGLNNSCLKSPASTLVDLTFQSRVLRSFSLNQLCNLS